MAALSLVYPVQNMINAVAIGFGIGINARVSYHLGAGDKKMAEVKIIYWSGTGNTAAMAQSVADGVAAAGAEAKIIPVENAGAADIADVKAFALGCPSMGAEQLEESSMEPFVEEILGSVSGKKILLFGSYGWGDGQWMRDWEDRMKAAGATVVGGEGVICQETPDDDALANCKALGKELAALA